MWDWIRNVALGFATLIIFAVTVMADWEHAPSPPGDEYLTNRFGVSWSEPIYSGYLLVDGKYIDAPYIVEQRGYKIMVNGTQVERIDPRTVLPLPSPEPVTEDPGLPQDLTHDSSLAAATWNTVYKKKRQYWDHLGLSGEERVRQTVEYLSQFPNIARVEDTGESRGPVGRLLMLYDHRGQSMPLGIESGTPSPKPPVADETIYGSVLDASASMERALKNRRLVLVRNGVLCAESDRPDSSSRWQSTFEIMAGDLPPEVKLIRLKALGLIREHETLRQAEGFFPVTYFQPSAQLWQRLSGDPAWTNEVEEMLYNLTNGWQQIPPKFQREEVPEQESPTPTEASKSVVDGTHLASTNIVTAPIAKHEPPLPASSEPAPRTSTTPACRSHCVSVLIVLGILIAVTCAVLYLKWRDSNSL